METRPEVWQPRQAALLLGVVLIIIGTVAFIPGVTTPARVDAPLMRLDGSYGYFLGLFPVNWLANVVRIGLGALGVWASFRIHWARTYLHGLTWVLAASVFFGVVPGLRTLWGLMPLYGDDVWLHLVALAVVAFYALGWSVKAGKSPDFSNA